MGDERDAMNLEVRRPRLAVHAGGVARQAQVDQLAGLDPEVAERLVHLAAHGLGPVVGDDGTVEDSRTRARHRVQEVAAELLEGGGPPALHPCRRRGRRRPCRPLHQLFGDEDAPRTALAQHAFDLDLADERALVETDDPVADLRGGWDAHVAIRLGHPACYLLMDGSDRAERRPPASDQAADQLRVLLDRTAAAGRLRVPPALAVGLLLAAVTGATLHLISMPEDERDLEVSDRLRGVVIASPIDPPFPCAAPSGSSDHGFASRSLALDAVLDDTHDVAGGDDPPLRSPGLALLRDWLHRLAR